MSEPPRDRVTVQVLKTELEHQSKFLTYQIVTLGERFEARCKVADERIEDHEDRLRSVETRTTWSRIIEGVLGLGSILLAWLGIKES